MNMRERILATEFGQRYFANQRSKRGYKVLSSEEKLRQGAHVDDGRKKTTHKRGRKPGSKKKRKGMNPLKRKVEIQEFRTSKRPRSCSSKDINYQEEEEE